MSSFHHHAGIQQISPLPNLQVFILPYHDFIFFCLSIHSDMTLSTYINRSHVPLFSLEINLNESMPPEKLLTHSHFLQDRRYCCPTTSTPTKPAVAVLLSLHLYHTSYRETGFHFLLLRLYESTLLLRHYSFLSCEQNNTLEDILHFTHALTKKKKK